MTEPKRCGWANGSDLEKQYHDEEWGVPSYDDRYLFEMLLLEGAQAGLSWTTVLNKRESYRAAFDRFDVERVASFDDAKAAELLLNPGIVRNRLKIASATRNAKAFLTVQQEFGGFHTYLWSFVDHTPVVNRPRSLHQVPATSPLSDAISKDLKKRGFNFVGTTIIYAYLQATGVIDDHLVSCSAKRS